MRIPRQSRRQARASLLLLAGVVVLTALQFTPGQPQQVGPPSQAHFNPLAVTIGSSTWANCVVVSTCVTTAISVARFSTMLVVVGADTSAATTAAAATTGTLTQNRRTAVGGTPETIVLTTQSLAAADAGYKVWINFSATHTYSIGVYELTKVWTTSVDVVGPGNTNTGSASASDTQTTTRNNDLVFLAAASSSNTTMTASGGNTVLNTQHAGATTTGLSDQTLATAGSITETLTLGSSVRWTAISISFVPSVAPAAAPTSLAAGTVTKTAIPLTWTQAAGGGVVNDTLYRWAGSSCSGTVTATSLGIAVLTTASGLATASTFSFEVAAWNTSGTSPVSSCVTATTLPSGVTALAVGTKTATTLAVSWTNAAGTLTNDSIAYTTTACTGSWTYASLGVVTSATLTGLSSATNYCIVVSDYSAGGATPNPTFVNGTTHAGPATSLTIGSVTTTTVPVTWTNAGGTISNVTGYRSTTACTGSWTIASLGVVTSNTFSGLSGATKYCIGIQEWSASGTDGTTFVNGTTKAGLASGISETGETLTTASISWTNPSGTLVNVTVNVGLVCGTWTQKNSAGVVTSFTITTLVQATTYCVGIQAWSSSGNSGQVFANVTTLAGTATSLTIGAVTTTTIGLTWTLSPGVLTNVTVLVGTVCNTWLQQNSMGSGSATSYTVTGLSSATTYCVAIREWNLIGPGGIDYNNGTTLPTAPSALTVGSVTTTTIPLTWSNPTGTLVNDTVYRWAGAACSGTVTATSLGSASTSNTQSGLASATQFAFEVAAWSSGGTSAVTSCVSGTTLPTAPTGLTVGTVTTVTIPLTWTNPSGTLVNDTVYRWAGSSCSGSATATSLGSAGTSNTQSGLATASTFSFEIQAWSAGGKSVVTSCVTGTTLPSGITGFSALVASSTSQLGLTWTNPSGTLSNNTVFYGVSCGSQTTHLSLGVVSSTTVTSLVSATTYCFRVSAWSAGGMGVLSSFVNATTLPAAPTSLSISAITTTGATVSWTNPGGTLVNDTIYIGTTCGSWTSSAPLGVATSATLGGLNPGTTYCFSATAWSAGGESAHSTGAMTTLRPLGVTGIVVGVVTSSTITVSWTNPSGNLTNISVSAGPTCGSWTKVDSAGVVTSHTVTGLPATAGYCVGIRAWTAGGGGVFVYANTTAAPAAPTNLWVGQTLPISAQLFWTVTGSGITNTSVSYGLSCSSWIGTFSPGPTTSYLVQGLQPTTAYCFGVREWLGTIPGAYSFVNATTPSTIPPGGGGGGGGGTGNHSNGSINVPGLGTYPTPSLTPIALGISAVLSIGFGIVLLVANKWPGWIFLALGFVMTAGMLVLMGVIPWPLIGR